MQCVGKGSDDGVRNMEQYAGRGRQWTCNNMRNPSLHYYDVIIVCPSPRLAFAFILLLISHAIIAAFACT